MFGRFAIDDSARGRPGRPITRIGRRGLAVRAWLMRACVALALSLVAASANAEKVLVDDGSWQVFTDGRLGGFVSWVRGDGYPALYTYGRAADGSFVVLHQLRGGGWIAPAKNHLLNDPDQPPTATDQGTIDMLRVRSGVLGNVFGFGLRHRLSASTRVTTYAQLSSFIEGQDRQIDRPNPIDVQQIFLEVDADWGTVLVGRVRELFARGALDIDMLYGHTWGVGFPAPIASAHGPTLGQVGFGVLGDEFAAGTSYATPDFAGFVLTAGLYEPLILRDNGALTRTQYLRPEGELTFEHDLGTNARLFLFVDGSFQKLYTVGACTPGQVCSGAVSGVGYGGRLEVGPVHFGATGYYAKGVGLDNAPDMGDASTDARGNLRAFDGYYAQAQLALEPLEFSAGAGITRIFLTPVDKQTVPDPRDPTGVAQVYPYSLIKYQLGINASVVYNFSPSVHFDIDYFRAQARWYLGEHQVLHAVNGGMTFSW
ncbi:MAG TPA: hypothetical protein VMI54_19325 [Polyangiaceae bacterium]|nr:hypothetical protein [Polyangiaceae bacterium]